MPGIAEQQLYGSDFMHGIYGRGGDYTESVGGYATWHPHGSSAPRRALTDLFPTLASSTVQSQSADRVHGDSSLHLSDMVSRLAAYVFFVFYAYEKFLSCFNSCCS